MSESRRSSTQWPALPLVPSRIRHFEQLAAQHIPNWERVHGEVTAAGSQDTGERGSYRESEIQRLWTGDEAVDATFECLQLSAWQRPPSGIWRRKRQDKSGKQICRR